VKKREENKGKVRKHEEAKESRKNRFLLPYATLSFLPDSRRDMRAPNRERP